MRKKIIYISITFLLVIIIILTGVFGKKEHDWTMSFTRYSKEPYGNFLLFEFLKTIFPHKKIITLHDPIYSIKNKNYSGYNYIFINSSCVFEEPDLSEILRFVSEGNNVFIAADMILNTGSGKFARTLGAETSAYMQVFKSTSVRFVNKSLGSHIYNLRLEGGAFYFSKFDRGKTAILSVNEKNDPVFIRVRNGRGYFYLSSIPLAFTNYTIVSKESNYPFIALSYLPVNNTLWDEFYKVGRMEAETPLRFILNRPPLRVAYILTIIFILLVIMSGAKRKERPIPVIPPLANTSLEFITTIGSLYYRNRNNGNIAGKMINHFLEFIRSRFYMDTRERGDAFYDRLALKTGMKRAEIKKIFLSIDAILSNKKTTDRDLKEIDSKIDEIYSKTRRA